MQEQLSNNNSQVNNQLENQKFQPEGISYQNSVFREDGNLGEVVNNDVSKQGKEERRQEIEEKTLFDKRMEDLDKKEIKKGLKKNPRTTYHWFSAFAKWKKDRKEEGSNFL